MQKFFKFTQILLGRLDYSLNRRSSSPWGGPFNGQLGRTRIVDEIIAFQGSEFVLETGTFRGTTTEYLSKKVGTVLSVENQPRNFGFAKQRFRRNSNVRVVLGNSARCLPNLLSGVPGTVRLFAYLDAHWEAELPLRHEIEAIYNWSKIAVVMIDDFYVPFDSGYKFDSYSDDSTLRESLIADQCKRFKLSCLYPALEATDETGAKRGCVVLASDKFFIAGMLKTGLLRLA